MKYNFDEIIDRKNNHSVKYNELARFGFEHGKEPEDFIPLWIADMDFKTAQPIIDALKKRLSTEFLGMFIVLMNILNLLSTGKRKDLDGSLEKSF